MGRVQGLRGELSTATLRAPCPSHPSAGGTRAQREKQLRCQDRVQPDDPSRAATDIIGMIGMKPGDMRRERGAKTPPAGGTPHTQLALVYRVAARCVPKERLGAEAVATKTRRSKKACVPGEEDAPVGGASSSCSCLSWTRMWGHTSEAGPWWGHLDQWKHRTIPTGCTRRTLDLGG